MKMPRSAHCWRKGVTNKIGKNYSFYIQVNMVLGDTVGAEFTLYMNFKNGKLNIIDHLLTPKTS